MSRHDTVEVQNILARLERVQKTGSRGYLARCPSHEDRTASLSIAVGRNGGVLLNCFGGCSVGEVVSSLGLEFKDLYPRRTTNDMSYEERAELQFASDRAKWAAALDTLCQEAMIVALAAHDMANGREVDVRRVSRASRRLQETRDILSTGPARRRLKTWQPEYKHGQRKQGNGDRNR